MNVQEKSKIKYHSRINRIMDYINIYLDQPLELKSIAEIANFPPFHFHRVFTFLVGEAPTDCIQHLRIEKAACQLRENMDIPISEIADSCGSCAIPLFSRVLKKFFGLTPNQFHKVEKPIYVQDGILFNKNGQMVSKNLTPKHVLSPQLYSVKFKISCFMETKIEVKETSDMKAVYCRHMGALKEIVKAYEKLIRWAEPRGLYIPNVTKSATVTHSDPSVTELDKICQSAYIIVEGDVKGEGEIGNPVILSGKCAVGHFELGTEDFEKAWNTMCKWLTESGYRQEDGRTRELYHNSHRTHPENRHIVDIRIPIKPLQRITCLTG